MEQYPDIGRGKPKFGFSKHSLKEKWEEFSVELNSLGPPTRASHEWQRVWIHYKAKLKRKLNNNKRNITATGGGPSERTPLTALEESVTQLVNMADQISPSGLVCGVDNVELPSPEPTPRPQPTNSRRINKNVAEVQRFDIIQEQVEIQREILTKVNEIEKSVYKSYSLNKQLLQLKKRKMALYEKQFEQANELHSLKVECLKKKLAKLNKP